MKTALAIIAALFLVALDYIVVAVAFLGQPRPGEIMLIILASLACTAVWFRRGWMLYICQSVVTLTILVRVIQTFFILPGEFETSMSPIAGFISTTLLLLLGFFAVWGITRAIPHRASKSP